MWMHENILWESDSTEDYNILKKEDKRNYRI